MPTLPRPAVLLVLPLVASCEQFRLIDDSTLCDAVVHAVAARVHACTGDAALASSRAEDFRAATTCRQDWLETHDQMEEAYACATAVSALSCTAVRGLGDDWDAWLQVDPTCPLVLGEPPPDSGGAGGDGSDGTDGGDGGDGTDGADGGDGTDGGDGGGPAVAAAGTLTRVETGEALSDAEVCLWDNDLGDFSDCAVPDASGAWQLAGIPARDERYLYVSGYDTAALFTLVKLGETDVQLDMGVLRSTQINAAASAVGVSATGPSHLQLQVRDAAGQPVEGATVSLSPPPAHGLIYLGAEGWDPALAATGPAGVAFAVNVEPQPYAVTVSHPSLSCEGAVPWVASPGDAAELWPASGYLHLLGLGCGE